METDYYGQSGAKTKTAVVPLPPSTAAHRGSSKAASASTIAKSPHRHHVTTSSSFLLADPNNNNINYNSSSSSSSSSNVGESSPAPNLPRSDDDNPLELKSHALLQQLVASIDGPVGHPETTTGAGYRHRLPDARKELLYLNSILDDMMVDLRKEVCNQSGMKWQPDKMVTIEDELEQQILNSLAEDSNSNDSIVTHLSASGAKKAKRLKSNYLHHFENYQKIYIEKSKLLAEELEVTKKKLGECEIERASYAALVGHQSSNRSDEIEIESFNRQLKFEQPDRPVATIAAQQSASSTSVSSSSSSSSSTSRSHHQADESLSAVIEKLLQSLSQDTSAQARVAIRNIRENKLSGSDASDTLNDIIADGSRKLQDLCRAMALQVDKERKMARANVESLSRELLSTQLHIDDLTTKNLDLNKQLQEKDIRIAKSIQFKP